MVRSKLPRGFSLQVDLYHGVFRDTLATVLHHALLEWCASPQRINILGTCEAVPCTLAAVNLGIEALSEMEGVGS